MNTRGHNENAVRLSILADDARTGLDRVEHGEDEAIKGWLAYGAALNEGRAMFDSDELFGQWVQNSGLSQLGTHEIKRDDRAAAMWAAGHSDQLAEAQATCNARTLRGWHDQWGKIDDARKKAAREAEAEAERVRLAAEAAEAKRIADEKAKAEKAAQAAVAKAQTDEDRERAEETAERAMAEKAEAEKVAAEAAAAVVHAAPVPEDPDAKARKELAKLTPDALIDDVIGLRAALADAKAKIKSLRAERDELKAKLANHIDDDKDAVIRRLSAEIAHIKSERFRAEEKFGAEKKVTYALKKRVAELENMGIVL